MKQHNTSSYTPGYHAPETLRMGWQGSIYDELVVDSFAGGGGASTGIELAIGRPVDIAINHDEAALTMHRVNHPFTRHFCESVWTVDPREVAQGRPVGLAWFSPDCTHFSGARGGKPKSKRIRGLAWVALRWAATVKPRVIVIENVKEFRTWGPLDSSGQPCKRRAGRTFNSFINALERQGYAVEHRVLEAHHYGAPTSRKRLFIIARRDGAPIVWPKPTHGEGLGLKPFRTAADCIDWSLPLKSIFDRNPPLKPATMSRIAKGLVKFVLENPRPFLIQVNHAGGDRNQEVTTPMPTITGKNGHALVVPYMVTNTSKHAPSSLEQPAPTLTTGNQQMIVAPYLAAVGGRAGNNPPRGVDMPTWTTTAKADTAVVAAFISKYYAKRAEEGSIGSRLDEPLHTVAATYRHHHLTAVYFTRQQGKSIGHEGDAPLGTVMAGRNKCGLVAAFLDKYHGTGAPQPVDDPLDTISTRDRYALVTVQIDGEEYVVTDIAMRMLTPRELFRAQGFTDNYVIAPEFKRPRARSRTLTQADQVRMVGNSVCPDVARAIVTANYVEQPLEMAAD